MQAGDLEYSYACPICGAAVPRDSRFCPGCGNPTTDRPGVCPACGHDVQAGSRFCARCGASLPLPDRQRDARLWTGVSVGAIWLSVFLISVLAADLVSGSEQEELPIAALTSWFWGAVATGLVLLLCRRTATVATALAVGGVWLAVTLVSILAPELVTGSDPTRVPVAAIVAPAAGAVATGFVCALLRG